METTIAAISTAMSASGIGIVRISGPAALKIGEKIFFAASGKALSRYPVQTMAYGRINDEKGEAVDEVLAVYMRAPHSYTA